VDPNAPNSDHTPLRSLDAVIQVGLVALLVRACGRIILPFTDILLWSVTLAVMLYPQHLRLADLAGRAGPGWLR
jgi:hypothetical protein